MEQQVSQGVKVKVETNFEGAWRNAEENGNYFSYTIHITNLNHDPVQLLRRQWYILDSLNGSRAVEGPGVVGEQPIIMHGQTYTYESGCNIIGDAGSMVGYYVFLNLKSNIEFIVNIPKFELFTPLILN
jgi:ApaG protein